jgi:hypothetical protein
LTIDGQTIFGFAMRVCGPFDQFDRVLRIYTYRERKVTRVTIYIKIMVKMVKLYKKWLTDTENRLTIFLTMLDH